MSSEKNNKLITAAALGSTQRTKKLLNAKADVNQQDQHGTSALMIATAHRFTALVKQLIAARANVNHANKHQQTAAYYALAQQDQEIIRLLAEAKANFNINGNLSVSLTDHGRPLGAAAEKLLNPQIVLPAFLPLSSSTLAAATPQDSSATASEAEPDNISEALLTAAKKGNLATVKTLLQKKAAVNHEDFFAATSLMHASARNHSQVVIELLTAKAHIDHQDNVHQTAAIVASISGSTDTLALLIDAKANLSLTDRQEKTALIRATIREQEPCVKMLLEAQAEISSRDQQSFDALIYASMHGYADIVTLLTQAKANPNPEEPYPHDTSPLSYAVSRGHVTTVEALITAKANPNSIDSHKNSPLSLAAGCGDKQIMQMLLLAKANLHAPPGTAMPLHTAIKNNQAETVALLVAAKADVQQTDSQGTPLDYANALENSQITALLLEAKARPSPGLSSTSKVEKWAMAASSSLFEQPSSVAAAPAATSIKPQQPKPIATTSTARIKTPVRLASNIHDIDFLAVIKKGDLKEVEPLVAAKADINTRNTDGNSALMVAIYKRNQDIADYLITAKAALQSRNKKGQTALILAAKFSSLTLVDRLLTVSNQRGLDGQDEEGNSALMIAAKEGRSEIVQKLLQAKAQQELLNQEDATALSLAVKAGHLATAALLGYKMPAPASKPRAQTNPVPSPAVVAAPKKPESKPKPVYQQRPARMFRTSRPAPTTRAQATTQQPPWSNKKPVQNSLEKALPPIQQISSSSNRTSSESTSSSSLSPNLSSTASSPATAVSTRQAKPLPPIFLSDSTTSSPASISPKELPLKKPVEETAADSTTTASPDLSASLPTTVAAPADEKQRPLQEMSVVVSSGSDENILSALQSGLMETFGALLLDRNEINLRDKHGSSLLHLAVLKGNLNAVLIILGCDASRALQLDYQQPISFATALMLAVEKRQPRIMGTLIAHKASLFPQNSEGDTALILAVKSCCLDTVKSLLKAHDAAETVNIPNRLGYTALSLASEQGNKELVAVLLAAHANPDAQKKDGLTALDLAQNSGIATMLSGAATSEAQPGVVYTYWPSQYVAYPSSIYTYAQPPQETYSYYPVQSIPAYATPAPSSVYYPPARDSNRLFYQSPQPSSEQVFTSSFLSHQRE